MCDCGGDTIIGCVLSPQLSNSMPLIDTYQFPPNYLGWIWCAKLDTTIPIQVKNNGRINIMCCRSDEFQVCIRVANEMLAFLFLVCRNLCENHQLMSQSLQDLFCL